MNTRRLAWLGLVGLVGGVSGFVAACGSSGDATSTQSTGSTGSGSTGECGDGTVDSGEQCDLGDENGTGNCTEECRLPICGDGIVNGEEDCDDGNFNNNDSCTNACINNPNLLCGNGKEDAGEECDDGNSTNNDGCTNFCTLPVCGDGIVQSGEDCDDGNNEIADVCPDDCQLDGPGPGSGGSGGGGAGGPGFGGGPIDCDGAVTFAGVVHTTDANVAQAISSVWNFGGFLGIQGGNQACAQDGYDHVCTYEEVKAAELAGELTGLYAMLAGTSRSFWVHRVSPVQAGNVHQPGAGARCNDWTYPTGHIAQGEYATVAAGGAITYAFDTVAEYTGISGDGKVGNHFVNQNGAAIASGGCTGNGLRAILCCRPVCGEVGQ